MFERKRLTPAGRTLVRQLQLVDERGLLLADYGGSRLAQLTAGLDRERPMSARNRASLDVALSIDTARFASDLQQRRVDPGHLGRHLDIGRPAFDAAAAVAALATAPDVAAALDAMNSMV
jgi:murein L,D-transpeptidase YcbB/YkuD